MSNSCKDEAPPAQPLESEQVPDGLLARRNSLGDFRSLTLRDLNECRLQRAQNHEDSSQDPEPAPAPVAQSQSAPNAESSSLLTRFAKSKSNRGSVFDRASRAGASSASTSERSPDFRFAGKRLPPLRTESANCMVPYRTLNGERRPLPSPKRRSKLSMSMLPRSQMRDGATEAKCSAKSSASEASTTRTKVETFNASQAKPVPQDADMSQEDLAVQERAAINIQAGWRGNRARNPSNSLWAMELRDVGVIGYSGAIRSAFPNVYLLITVRNKWTSHVSACLSRPLANYCPILSHRQRATGLSEIYSEYICSRTPSEQTPLRHKLTRDPFNLQLLLQTIFQTVCRPNSESQKSGDPSKPPMRIFDELLVFPGLDNNCVLCASLFQQRSMQADIFIAQTSVPFSHIRHAALLGLSVFKLELASTVRFRHGNTASGQPWEYTVVPHHKVPPAGTLQLGFQAVLFAPQQNLSGK
jgi:hypothetical protein